jgi:hypothetical protein
MLRQAADYPPPGRDGNLPLVILEPVGDGLYRITGELSDEQAQAAGDLREAQRMTS